MTHKQISAKGGRAGRGKAKARTRKQAQAVARARWKHGQDPIGRMGGQHDDGRCPNGKEAPEGDAYLDGSECKPIEGSPGVPEKRPDYLRGLGQPDVVETAAEFKQTNVVGVAGEEVGRL